MLLTAHIVIKNFKNAFGIKKKKKKCFIVLKIYEYMNWIYTIIWIEYINWIYIKLLHKQSKGEISLWGRSSVTDIRIVYVFVLSYTSYFHIVEVKYGWFQNKTRYSHRITMHVVTSDYAGMITNCDIHRWY